MKGLPGWLFAAGSALPLRLRTAVRAEQQAWGSLALQLIFSRGIVGVPAKVMSGKRIRAVSLRYCSDR